jgi:hypothetical protein
MTKKLLTAASLAEGLFGIFVLAFPGFAYDLLFGSQAAASGIIMTRVAGVALIGLGVACFPPGTTRAFYGMLGYNILVMLYLIAVGIGGSAGVLLWPGVAFHALMSVSLIASARLKGV